MTVRTVFRVAAGPRIGYGHLVRASVLGRAWAARPAVSLRGGAAARAAARSLGCRVLDESLLAAVRRLRPDLVVIDDPSPAEAAACCRAMRRAGVRVASVHDLGLGYCGADLTIDGSVVHPRGLPPGRALVGPRFAILREDDRRTRVRRTPRSVLVALGGGPRATAAERLALSIRRAHPAVAVRVAGGFGRGGSRPAPGGITWIGPRKGLAGELARTDVAVVGGGVTLYEACRTGTPAVGVAVVPAQRPTITGFARLGAARDGGSIRDLPRALREVSRLIGSATLRTATATAGRAVVDGRGAVRVAEALAGLAGRGRSL